MERWPRARSCNQAFKRQQNRSRLELISEIASATAVCWGPDGKILTEGRLRSTPETMARHFQDLPPSRIAIEVGTHSRWVSQLLGQWGHEVIVANPRNLRMIADSIRKSDQVDAHMLARLARVDPKLLSPIVHRKQESYPYLIQLKARDSLGQEQNTTNECSTRCFEVRRIARTSVRNIVLSEQGSDVHS